MRGLKNEADHNTCPLLVNHLTRQGSLRIDYNSPIAR